VSGLRVGLVVPGATASEMQGLGRLADHWNITTLWIGDPDGRADNRLDSYVTAAAAAVAAVTSHVRLGLFLSLRVEKQLLRLAEDVAVLDQASGGRVELGLVPPGSDLDGWTDGAARLLRAWNAWQIADSDEVVPVVPGPLQPVIPRLVVGGGPAANALAGGRMVQSGAAADPSPVPMRTVMRVPLDEAVAQWRADDVVQRVLDLRSDARQVGAQEVVFVLTTVPTKTDVKIIGTVLVTALRAADRDAASVAGDAWSWLHQRAHLHAPPGA
jgi:alkanesulfonate monooxygenase SsuD/methylene tetrahydromethanopterin reductase-like flavin-dependent oxidoreductase (luciferase family)